MGLERLGKIEGCNTNLQVPIAMILGRNDGGLNKLVAEGIKSKIFKR